MADLKRFLLFLGLWLVISEAHLDLLHYGVLAAAAATAISRLIWRRSGRTISIFAVLAYMPGFLWRSLMGGIDVAWRVFHPRLPIAPAFLAYDSRDDDETGRVLLTDILSLMPGTLGAGLAGRRATIHLLADEPATRRLIEEEDSRLAHIFADPAADGEEEL
jgi:multicomponent Na+:H+ antiporter subunit E